MAVRKKPKVPQPAAPSSADGEVVRPVNTLVAKRKPAAQPPTASSRTDEVSRSTQPPAVNTLVAKKKPKKPSQPAAPDAPAESSARKVKFSPFAEVKEIEPARRTPAVNDLSSVARKKKKKGGADAGGGCAGRTPPNSPSQGNAAPVPDPAEVAASVARGLDGAGRDGKDDKDNGEGASGGEKRPFEPGVTVLLPKRKNKKKMKAASGSAPVATG